MIQKAMIGGHEVEIEMVYLVVYFEHGEKKILRRAFQSAATAQLWATTNKLDSWHTVQLEVYPD